MRHLKKSLILSAGIAALVAGLHAEQEPRIKISGGAPAASAEFEQTGVPKELREGILQQKIQVARHASQVHMAYAELLQTRKGIAWLVSNLKLGDVVTSLQELEKLARDRCEGFGLAYKTEDSQCHKKVALHELEKPK